MYRAGLPFLRSQDQHGLSEKELAIIRLERLDGHGIAIADGGNLGASHVSATGDVEVPSYRLLTILNHNAITHVDALKIDVEGYEDRVLVPFFRDAPQALWPTAVAIEHLERKAWQDDCIADMVARGYAVAGKTRSNTLLVFRS